MRTIREIVDESVARRTSGKYMTGDFEDDMDSLVEWLERNGFDEMKNLHLVEKNDWTYSITNLPVTDSFQISIRTTDLFFAIGVYGGSGRLATIDVSNVGDNNRPSTRSTEINFTDFKSAICSQVHTTLCES